MSRYCGKTKTGPILEASTWRDVSLLDEGSVFTNKRLWTVSNLEALYHHFGENGEGKWGRNPFFADLEAALAQFREIAIDLTATEAGG